MKDSQPYERNSDVLKQETKSIPCWRRKSTLFLVVYVFPLISILLSFSDRKALFPKNIEMQNVMNALTIPISLTQLAMCSISVFVLYKQLTEKS